MSVEGMELGSFLYALDASSAPLTVGHIVEVAPDGGASVDFAGNNSGPIRARSLIVVSPDSLLEGLPILLAFEGSDFARPIILGFVHDRLHAPGADGKDLALDERPDHIAVDGETVEIAAKKEIVLRCGKSSIALRKDGKIIVRGTKILSRATEVNKVQGGSVRIN